MRICWHVVTICGFIIFEKIVGLIIAPKSFELVYLLYYVPVLGLFYLNTYYVLKLWKKRLSSVIAIALLSLLEVLCYCFICLCINSIISHLGIFDSKVFNKFNNVTNVWRATYFWGISLTYWLYLTNIRSTKEIARLAIEKAEMEKQKVSLENAFLRSAVNPHFISNSLNSVYAMAEPISYEVSKAIYNISEFVHYSYATKDGKLIELGSIEGEIEQIKRCLEIRKGNSASPNVRLNQDIDSTIEFTIPPMLLVSLVENIFDHGDLSDPEKPAIVTIILNENNFHFQTENLIKTSPSHKGSGIGLGGAGTRLNAYFPGRHSLTTNSNQLHHNLNLKINL